MYFIMDKVGNISQKVGRNNNDGKLYVCGVEITFQQKAPKKKREIVQLTWANCDK